MASNNDVPAIKIVLCGEKGVGKTAIYERLKDDKFYDRESHTVPSDECMLSFPCGKHTVKVIAIYSFPATAAVI